MRLRNVGIQVGTFLVMLCSLWALFVAPLQARVSKLETDAVTNRVFETHREADALYRLEQARAAQQQAELALRIEQKIDKLSEIVTRVDERTLHLQRQMREQSERRQTYEHSVRPMLPRAPARLTHQNQEAL